MSCARPRQWKASAPSPMPLPAWERVGVRAARRLVPRISEGEDTLFRASEPVFGTRFTRPSGARGATDDLDHPAGGVEPDAVAVREPSGGILHVGQCGQAVLASDRGCVRQHAADLDDHPGGERVPCPLERDEGVARRRGLQQAAARPDPRSRSRSAAGGGSSRRVRDETRRRDRPAIRRGTCRTPGAAADPSRRHHPQPAWHNTIKNELMRKTSRPPGRSRRAASGTQRCGSAHRHAPYSEMARSKLASG